MSATCKLCYNYRQNKVQKAYVITNTLSTFTSACVQRVTKFPDHF